MTAPLGIRLAHVLPPWWLNLVFVAVMLVVAWRMFMSSQSGSDNGTTKERDGVCKLSAETGRFIWGPRTVVTFSGIGAISGLFTGMLGVGGGFISVPAWGFAMAVLAGMAAARRVAPKISSSLLQRVFSLACIVVATMMLVRNVG